jgi:hypothetical protein
MSMKFSFFINSKIQMISSYREAGEKKAEKNSSREWILLDRPTSMGLAETGRG